MKQVSDYNTFDLADFFQSAESRIAEITNPVSRQRYGIAIGFLKNYANLFDEGTVGFSKEFLSDWIVYMWSMGIPTGSLVWYFDIVSSLYNAYTKNNLKSKDNLFSELKVKLKEIDSKSRNKGLGNSLYSHIVSVLKGSHESGDNRIAIDMVLFSLLNGCMPLMEMAKLKRADINSDVPEIKDIVVRNADEKKRRKYLFNLSQILFRPKALSLHVQSMVNSMFKLHRIPAAGNPMDVIESIYAFAALKCGVSGTDIVSALGHVPLGLPILAVCEQKTIDEDRKEEIAKIVARVFAENPSKWYAMRLRRGVQFKSLEDRLEILKENLPHIPLFYLYCRRVQYMGRSAAILGVA